MDGFPQHHGSPDINGNGPPPKRFKALPEDPVLYSNAVRRKYATASRTGQACDRCKERKMKCDSDGDGCRPCRQKNLPCLTTDRVTGRASERGRSDRLENELQQLRTELAIYKQRYGPLDLRELETHSNGYNNEPSRTPSSVAFYHYETTEPESIPAEVVYDGPVNGTIIDLIGSKVDIGGYPSEQSDKPFDEEKLNVFDFSGNSLVKTLSGLQKIADLKMPPWNEAQEHLRHFCFIIWPFVPVIHKASFLKMAERYYQDPKTVTRAEEVQLVLVLAFMANEKAIRDQSLGKEDRERYRQQAYRLLHYGFGFYGLLFQESSLASMQALTLCLLMMRDLPKPGYSWNFAQRLLVRAIDSNFHRNPDRMPLPRGENNPLCKELRKRTFWALMTFCLSIGTRLCKPGPWHLQRFDVPLPEPIRDDEWSIDGPVSPRSGTCDFLVAIHVMKLLPLLTELYCDVISVRRSASDYRQTVETLDAKILAWQDEWTTSTTGWEREQPLDIQTLMIETWAAEYQLNLHHPMLDTSGSQEMYEKNLMICWSAAKKLMKNFRRLVEEFRGAEFTWHSIGVYALAFGLVLHIYERRKSRMSREEFGVMKQELDKWTFTMVMVDSALQTSGHLSSIFGPRVRQLEKECEEITFSKSASTSDYHPALEESKTITARADIEEMSTKPVLPYSQRDSTPYDSLRESPIPSILEGIHPPMLYPHPPMTLDAFDFAPYPLPKGQPLAQSSYRSYNTVPPLNAHAYSPTPASSEKSSVPIYQQHDHSPHDSTPPQNYHTFSAPPLANPGPSYSRTAISEITPQHQERQPQDSTAVMGYPSDLYDSIYAPDDTPKQSSLVWPNQYYSLPKI